MADIFITGGTGFVGSTLINRLRDSGHHIMALARQINKTMPGDDEVEWIQGDLLRPESYMQYVGKADYIFHLAGMLSSRRREDFIQTNVTGTESLLKVCAKSDAPSVRFIYMSSIAAMGPDYHGQLLDESSICNPNTEYGRSKLEAEKCVEHYAESFPIVILRPSFIYGRGDMRGLTFIKTVMKQTVLIGSGIIKTVSICHVSDVVESCILSMDADLKSKSVFIISDPEIYTLTWLLNILKLTFRKLYKTGCSFGNERLVQIVDRLENISIAPTKSSVSQYWGCDIRKAKSILRFKSRVTLKDGAFDTVQWYYSQGLLENEDARNDKSKR